MIKKGFLKGHASVLNFLLRFFDLCVVVISGVVTYYFSPAYQTYMAQGVLGLPEHYIKAIVLAVVLSAIVFPVCMVYRMWRGTSTFSEIKTLTLAWIMVGLLLTGIAFATQSGLNFSRSWMGLWLFSAWVLFIGLRVSMRIILRWLRSNGFNHRHIVMVGTGDQATVVAQRLQHSTWFGLEISALFGPDTEQLRALFPTRKRIDSIAELRSYVDENGVDQVWISLPHSEEKTIRDVITALDGSVADIRYVPDIFQYQLMHHSLSEIAGVPVVNISYSAIDGANRVIKAAEDYILSIVLLMLTAA